MESYFRYVSARFSPGHTGDRQESICAWYSYGILWASSGCGVGLSSHWHASHLYLGNSWCPVCRVVRWKTCWVLLLQLTQLTQWRNSKTISTVPRCLLWCTFFRANPSSKCSSTNHSHAARLLEATALPVDWREIYLFSYTPPCAVSKADKLKHESAEIVVPLLEDKVKHCWFLYLWSSPKKQRAFQHFSKPVAFDPYLPIGRKDLMTEGRWKKTLRLVKPESLQTQPPSVKHWQNGENIQMSSNVPTFLWKNKAFSH